MLLWPEQLFPIPDNLKTRPTDDIPF
jgi:hypothetical protein